MAWFRQGGQIIFQGLRPPGWLRPCDTRKTC